MDNYIVLVKQYIKEDYAVSIVDDSDIAKSSSLLKKDTIFLTELKECSRRIYEIPKFIFYVLGYAIERVLSKGHTGIDSYIPPKVKSQQLTLFESFNLADSGGVIVSSIQLICVFILMGRFFPGGERDSFDKLKTARFCRYGMCFIAAISFSRRF